MPVVEACGMEMQEPGKEPNMVSAPNKAASLAMGNLDRIFIN